MTLNLPTTADSSASPPRPMLVIRDLPGLMDLEGKAILYGLDDLDQMAAKLTARHFHIEVGDLASAEIGVPELDIEDARVAYTEYPRHLITSYLADDEITSVMLEHGVDFRDSRGQPLKCIHLLAGAVEAALKGIAGQLPEPGAFDPDSAKAKLDADVRAFLSRKRR